MKYTVTMDTDIMRRRRCLLITGQQQAHVTVEGVHVPAQEVYIKPFVFAPVKELEDSGDYTKNCTLSAQYDEFDALLQALVDAAWEQGIRPKGSEDTHGELKATKFHLEDMRTLAKVNK